MNGKEAGAIRFPNETYVIKSKGAESTLSETSSPAVYPILLNSYSYRGGRGLDSWEELENSRKKLHSSRNTRVPLREKKWRDYNSRPGSMIFFNSVYELISVL